MIDLLFIKKDFPIIKSQPHCHHSEVALSLNTDDPLTGLSINCGYQPESKVPDRPAKLPSEAIVKESLSQILE